MTYVGDVIAFYFTDIIAYAILTFYLGGPFFLAVYIPILIIKVWRGEWVLEDYDSSP